MTELDHALQRLARHDSGRVLAIVARRFGSFDIADEATQHALVRAAERWPIDGIPDNPAAWLMTVAKNRAIDLLRLQRTQARRLQELGRDLVVYPEDDVVRDPMTIPTVEAEWPDERLRLMILCCHPALGADAQVSLILRVVGGLTTQEIAAAFFTTTPTIAQRITRAKSKIRRAGIPLSLPADLNDRIATIMQVLYVIFNEGYLTRSDHESPTRVDLCVEAIRLTEVVVGLVPDHAEARGMLALQRFTHARRDARFGPEGVLVLLGDQDRSTWQRDEIRQANVDLHQTMAMMSPGPYQLQALIAAHHANAPSSDQTDWAQIVAIYDQLRHLDSSPVVTLNRAAAVGMASGPEAGLSALAEVAGLDDYHLRHVVEGEFLARGGRVSAGIESLSTALTLTTNSAERDHLRRRVAELGLLV